MKLLLDTHALLWALADQERLSPNAKRAIISDENLVFVSMVSLWELTIKQGLKKINLPANLFDKLEKEGFETLPLTFGHLNRLQDLPLLHRDPFDRMLVAQAQHEQLTLVTRDEKILEYNVSSLQA